MSTTPDWNSTSATFYAAEEVWLGAGSTMKLTTSTLPMWPRSFPTF